MYDPEDEKEDDSDIDDELGQWIESQAQHHKKDEDCIENEDREC